MSDIAIQIENLSKEFVIDGLGDYQRLTEAFASWIRRKLRRSDENETVTGKADIHSTKNIGRRKFLALDSINLQVNRGETLGIVGSNGAGKSTLLKVLSRITSPTRGRVGVAGRIGCLLEVGTGFHPELTGRENVFLNGAILGLSRREIRKRFDEIVDFAEVEKFLDVPVKRYSNGMLIRLGFSVAAHLDPDVLIVDEVLGVGDAAFQKKSLGKAREFRNDGRTVLMVSHNLPMIASFCTRAVLLRDGRLVADALPTEVIDQHLASAMHAEAGFHSNSIWTDTAGSLGTEYMKLKRIEVADQSGKAAITLDSDIDIQINYEVTQSKHRVCLQLSLIDETGLPIFKCINAPAMNSDIDPLYDQELDAGNYTCTVSIPKNFLNARKYLITLSIGEEPNRVDQIVDSILGFQVIEATENLVGTNVFWDGYLVRPKLAWKTRKLS